MNLNLKSYVQILLFPIDWCLELLAMRLLYPCAVWAESYEFARRLVHVCYCHPALCACMYVSRSPLSPPVSYFKWKRSVWQIGRRRLRYFMSCCEMAHRCFLGSICRRVFSCVLVLAATGYLEVISHTGAANDTTHELEHFLLLTQHSTLINKVCPPSIARLSIRERRQHVGHGAASVVMCGAAPTAGTMGDLGRRRIASDGTRQRLIRRES